MAFPLQVEGATFLRFAHDGALLVVTEQALVKIDAKTSKQKQLIAINYGGPLEVAGKRALVGADKKVLHLDLAKAKPAEIAKLSTTGDGACSIALSPDQRFVLVVGSDEGGTLKCFELGKPRALYTIGSVRYARTVWTPDGTRFVTASCNWSARVKVHDAKRGDTVVDLGDPHHWKSGDEPGPSVDALVMAPSGEHLWFGSRVGVGRLPLVAKANAEWLVRDHNVGPLVLAGKRLWAGCRDGKLLAIDLATNQVETFAVDGEVHDLALSTDGKQLAFIAGDRVHLRAS